MMVIGMLVMGYGCYFYIGCELGCGLRDGLMVGISAKLKKPIKLIRGSIEFFVLLVGVILGGKVRIGTLISAFAIGYFIQLIFKICKFDAINVKHKSVFESIKI